MLQALPDTALFKRLAREGRLIEGFGGDINQTTLMNFVPTRPVEEIAREYVEGFWKLYDPNLFLDRVFRHFMLLKEATYPRKPRSAKKKLNWVNLRAMGTIFWRQGVVRKSRIKFWRQLVQMIRLNRGGIGSYLSTCSQAEHLLAYRELVRKQIAAQLADRRSSAAAAPSAMGVSVTFPSRRSRVELPVLQ
jgi:hypothetical protein